MSASFSRLMPIPRNYRRRCGLRYRFQLMAQPTPVIALAVSGMNDVLNSQGYTQAAWWNRIPIAAWGLMISDRYLLQSVGRLCVRGSAERAAYFWFCRWLSPSRSF